ncbi:MAG: osmotically inducible protein OsmC [Planctomycetes bacterium]|nr:osmotically inducible protein OsmC [Planctomycetota bacterium]
MVQIDITYEGDLHTNARHEPSGAELTTDAPKDNEGLGESFSPTDLLATALGSCMVTIMGIYARRKDLDIRGTTVRVEKRMTMDPVRRIGKLVVRFGMPAGIPEEHRPALARAAAACPVHKSLHPDVERPVEFCYPD